jgi:hypothetical protein
MSSFDKETLKRTGDWIEKNYDPDKELFSYRILGLLAEQEKSVAPAQAVRAFFQSIANMMVPTIVLSYCRWPIRRVHQLSAHRTL